MGCVTPISEQCADDWVYSCTVPTSHSLVIQLSRTVQDGRHVWCLEQGCVERWVFQAGVVAAGFCTVETGLSL
jgi:hypothetical protein